MEHLKPPRMISQLQQLLIKTNPEGSQSRLWWEKGLLHSNFISMAETEVSLNLLTICLGLSSAENLSPLHMNNGI